MMPRVTRQSSYKCVRDSELADLGRPVQMFDEAVSLVGIRHTPTSKHERWINPPCMVWSDPSDKDEEFLPLHRPRTNTMVILDVLDE